MMDKEKITHTIKTYGALINGYWVKGRDGETLKLSTEFSDLVYTDNKEDVINFIKTLKQKDASHDYALVTITIDLSDIK